MTARYVEVPASLLVATLDTIGLKVRDAGGDYRWRVQGRERVFDLIVPANCTSTVTVRVFTSLAEGESSVRERGKDAVRVVLGVGQMSGYGFRPLEKGRKMLRTAPAGDDPEARALAFLGRLTDLLRAKYADAMRIPACPACGAAMAKRATKASGSEFWGCSRFPECRGIVRTRVDSR